mgnify:FL=1
MINKDGSIRMRNRQAASVQSRTAKVTTSPAPWDKSEEEEFTAAWHEHAVKFQANPFIACPECEGSDHVGQQEQEKFKLMSSGIYEPVGTWVTCDNCNGLGEIQADENMEN